MYTWPSAEFNDGFNTFTFSNAIEYRQDGTPIITSVTPANGDVFGGYNITIGGSYLDIGAVSVMIDGVECVFQTGTASQIIC